MSIAFSDAQDSLAEDVSPIGLVEIGGGIIHQVLYLFSSAALNIEVVKSLLRQDHAETCL